MQKSRRGLREITFRRRTLDPRRVEVRPPKQGPK
jgi:hypothetical protein